MTIRSPLSETVFLPTTDPACPALETLPTMYDLPSEDPEEPGLPDDFHYYQPQLLRETFCPPTYPPEQVYVATDLNLYYDIHHTRWYKRPDWFAVLGVSKLAENGDLRWSYVIWQEQIVPCVVIELLSEGTEAEDLGQTLREVNQPPTKWEVYERILRIPYYLIYDRRTRDLQTFEWINGRYQKTGLTDGRLWLSKLQLGLGIWSGCYEGIQAQWIRWYDTNEIWIPTIREQGQQQIKQVEQRVEQERQRAEQERQRAEQERQRAEQERQRAEQLAAQLKALGIEPHSS